MVMAVTNAVDVAAENARLKAELASARAELTGAKLLIEQLRAQLAVLRRMQFGRSSEKLDAQIMQLELMLEDLEEGEAERAVLAHYFGVDETLLGATKPVGRSDRGSLKLVPQLAVGASAGAGALNDGEWLAGKVGFDPGWLRKLGVDPDKVSIIRVEGESMTPTLNDGDDIMVDRGGATGRLREGVHVVRFDDSLMVKRLVPGPGGRLSLLSDNPAYPDWSDLAVDAVEVIGRVVWVGRRL